MGENRTIKEEWKIFCRELYANLLRMERKSEIELEESFRLDKPYADRKRILFKIRMCDDYKQKIIESVKEREFVIKDGDVEIIEKFGYRYYFRYVECGL